MPHLFLMIEHDSVYASLVSVSAKSLQLKQQKIRAGTRKSPFLLISYFFSKCQRLLVYVLVQSLLIANQAVRGEIEIIAFLFYSSNYFLCIDKATAIIKCTKSTTTKTVMELVFCVAPR